MTNVPFSDSGIFFGHHQGSISPTFYAQLFLYESFSRSFFVLEVKVKLFIGTKKMEQMRSKNVDEIDS